MLNAVSHSSYKLLLIDEDPIFLLGLATLCEQFPDLQVVDRVTDSSTAFASLARETPAEPPAASPPQPPIHLVVLDLHLGPGDADSLDAPTCIQQLQELSPQLPILLLSGWPDPDAFRLAYRPNVKGYCTKGIAGAELIRAIRTVAAGNSYWEVEPPATPSSPGIIARWLDEIGRSGVQQIEAEMAQVQASVQHPQLSQLDRLFLEGRQRELLAARWMVNQLFAPSMRLGKRKLYPRGFQGIRRHLEDKQKTTGIRHLSPRQDAPRRGGDRPPVRVHNGELLPAAQAPLEAIDLQARLFNATEAKIDSPLLNRTGKVMEIDILHRDKKQELLYTVVRQFEEVLGQLRYSQVQADRLAPKRDRVLLDLWEMAIAEFFGKYYSLHFDTLASEGQTFPPLELVPILLEDASVIQGEILSKIPLTLDLLAYLLYKVPLTIDNRTYPPESPEAMQRATVLLENLILQLANAAIQPLLNRFADVEVIKQDFFDREWLSTREIERFRNDLSWKYRTEKNWREPKAIFESQYRLLVLSDRGTIEELSIYSPRDRELSQLRGGRLLVTLLLETRDAIAPRLRGLLLSLGSGARYLLIQLGRGIGLVGRGILQGIGNALQESRFDKNKKEEQK